MNLLLFMLFGLVLILGSFIIFIPLGVLMVRRNLKITKNREKVGSYFTLDSYFKKIPISDIEFKSYMMMYIGQDLLTFDLALQLKYLQNKSRTNGIFELGINDDGIILKVYKFFWPEKTAYLIPFESVEAIKNYSTIFSEMEDVYELSFINSNIIIGLPSDFVDSSNTYFKKIL